MLELKDVNAGYGRSQVLFGVSLTVGTGEAVSLVGANGAGKSTLLKAIAGIVAPSAGAITFNGCELAGCPSHRIARQGVGYVPEGRRIFSDLSVAENLEVGRRAAPTGRPAWTIDRVFALFPPLAGLMRRVGGTLSGGEQQMLAIARTLMGNPTLLLLDEPAEGLAPLMVEATESAVRAIKAEGVSLLLSEQTAGFAGDSIDRAFRMERGRLTETAV